MYSEKSSWLAVSLLWAVLTVVFMGRIIWMNETTSLTDTLESVEIREYRGQKLSSIDDFRENSIKGPQFVDKESYKLVVTGVVQHEIEYTYDDIVKNQQPYKKVVTLHCVEGWDVTVLWEGVLVKDLVEEAGIHPTAEVVIFYAYDGYSTSLPLDFVVDNNILMAYKMNGVVLPPERGFPFQLVAESKYGYKWIKWIAEIELSDNEDYRGYWESRGFSNNADLLP
ncbi:MAG: molybdopterin-dependent oxidoreductase [Candidatus Bathyarchaeota archaeon]|nr:molybdopterin-dependent oxidoreductase [Candidatus Bathyarchaeota archaeon]MDH5733174.1 molybdopterin-dependent oxidoreductase [Candidatus Bathyarchaeota archaeon]